MKKLIMFMMLAATALSAFAKTNYVDCALGDYTGHKGTSWADAFETIQEAVDAAVAGDTVLVAPGTYKKGLWTGDGKTRCRVYVDKQLTIRSRGGKYATEIVGLRSATSSGIGLDAIKCVYVNGASGTRIEGFTLRDGAGVSSASDANENNGGGLCVSGSQTDVYLVDCIVRNCSGRGGGALRGGTAIRCLIDRCTFAGGNGAAGRNANFYNCVIAGCFGPGPAMIQSGILVNCSVCCNSTAVSYGLSSADSYNCVFTMNGVSNAGGRDGNNPRYFACAVAGAADVVTADPDCDLEADPQAFFAPAFFDYRLLPGHTAIGLGKAEYLVKITVPDEDRYLDFNGNDIPAEGAIAAGAVQEIAPVPTSGAVWFGSEVEVDGIAGSTVSGWAYPESYPTQFHVKAVLAEGESLWAYGYGMDKWGYDDYRFPEMDESLYVMPPKTPGTFLTNSVVLAEQVLYVSPTGSNANNGLTDLTPLKTLSNVVAKAGIVKKTVIHAAAGEYAEESVLDGEHLNRVSLFNSFIRLKGAGAALSTIRGLADTTIGTDRHGCGTNAMRCVMMGGSFIDSLKKCTGRQAVQGFTLADGHASSGVNLRDDGSWSRGGAVFVSGNAAMTEDYYQILDCTINNGAAIRGSVFGGWCIRCRISDCWGAVGTFRYNRFTSCVFPANDGNESVIGGNGYTIITSTAIGKSSNYEVISAAFGRHYFSIFRNAANNKSYGSNFEISGCVADGFASATGTGFVRGDACFVNAANSDLRVLVYSPALSAGGTIPDDFHLFASSDIDGRPLLFKDGVPMAGAYQRPVACAVVSPAVGATVSHVGTNVLDVGTSLTVTATDITRPFKGFEVNGDFSAGSSVVIPAPAVGAAVTAPYSVVPVVDTNWYVNAAAAADGDGFTPETPKQTLKGALTSHVLAGDTIHVAPGDYRTDPMTQTERIQTAHSDGYEGYSIRSRAIIPDGVTLVADGTAAETIIRGASATEFADSVGRGTNAVRCVAMLGKSRLIGFTLTDGRTGRNGTSDDDHFGAGILASSTNAYVFGCVITNCASTRGGGAFYGTYVNCLFTGNQVDNSGAHARYAHFFGCTFEKSIMGYSAVQGYYSLVNCYAAADNAGSGQTFMDPSTGADTRRFANNIVFGTFDGKAFTAYNCIFDSAKFTPSDVQTLVGCNYKTAAEIGIDAAGHPTAVNEWITDKGLADALPENVVTDLAGGQRVYNRAIDIGPFEYDWRDIYAATLGSGVTVSLATPGIRKDGDNLAFTDGDRLALAWQPGKAGRRTFEVGLADGALDVLRDGEPWRTLTESGEVKFKSTLETENLEFAYADGSGAWLGNLLGPRGLLMFVR